MKQKYLLFTIILIVISACKTIQFETSQPKDVEELTEFPNEIIGNYVSKEKDTLLIFYRSFQFIGSKIGSGKENRLIPNETVLKKSNDYFVISIKDSNIWGVIAIKQKGNKLLFYVIGYDKDDEVDLIKRLKEITKVVEIRNDEDKNVNYLINPSKEEFQLLLDKKVFSKIAEYKKIK